MIKAGAGPTLLVPGEHWLGHLCNIVSLRQVMSASEPSSKRARAEVKADLGPESCPAGTCSPHVPGAGCLTSRPTQLGTTSCLEPQLVSWFPDLQGRAGVGRSRFTPGHLAEELPVTPASRWRC